MSGLPPYAAPANAGTGARDAQTTTATTMVARTAPYVPALWRDAVAVDTPLPWIEAFLASTPATPVAAVTERPSAERPSAGIPFVDRGETGGAVPHASEEWPLADALSQFRAFAARIEATGATSSQTSVSSLYEPFEPAPLSAWSDDDLRESIPLRYGVGPVPPSGSSGTAGAQPEHAREAAQALELLARRVRAGELTLPTYDPRMGEPAALVAALAALLGVRLR